MEGLYSVLLVICAVLDLSGRYSAKRPEPLRPREKRLAAVFPEIPKEFVDKFRAGRDKWSTCLANINTVADQGPCKTCSSVAAASVLSNRICISTHKDGAVNPNADLQISASQASACVIKKDPMPTPADNCQQEMGRHPSAVYNHAAFIGLVTGGGYQSEKGCVPYPVRGIDMPVIKNEVLELPCVDACTKKQPYNPQDLKVDATKRDPDLDLKQRIYAADKRRVASYWGYAADRVQGAAVDQNFIDRIKNEILTNGPITAYIVPFKDTTAFAGERVISKESDHEKGGGHTVRIVGWEVFQGKKCWTVYNSWGIDNVHTFGLLRVEMGFNVMNIESDLSAPIVALPEHACNSADFTSHPVTSAIWIDVKDHRNGVYLFSGPCTQRVQFNGDILETVKSAQLTQATFVGAPAEITSNYYDGTDSYLFNSYGDSARCTDVDHLDPQRFRCIYRTSKPFQTVVSPFFNTVVQKADFYQWAPDAMATENFRTFASGSVPPSKKGDIASHFTQITALLNRPDSKSMLVFGYQDKVMKVGILAYATAAGGPYTWIKPPVAAAEMLKVV